MLHHRLSKSQVASCSSSSLKYKSFEVSHKSKHPSASPHLHDLCHKLSFDATTGWTALQSTGCHSARSHASNQWQRPAMVPSSIATFTTQESNYSVWIGKLDNTRQKPNNRKLKN